MDSITGQGRPDPATGPQLVQHQTATGRLTAVHEGSLRLITEAGIDMPMQVPDDSSLDIEELRRFQEAQTPVVVEFEGSPAAHGGRVYAVRPA